MDALVIFIFIFFAGLFRKGTCATFTGLIVNKGKRDGHLVFNCSASTDRTALFVEFLINNSSVASCTCDNDFKNCPFRQSQINCNECRCYSDGRVYTWSFPFPELKTDTSICYSCDIFVQIDFAERARICYNTSDFEHAEKSTDKISTWSKVYRTISFKESYDMITTTDFKEDPNLKLKKQEADQSNLTTVTSRTAASTEQSIEKEYEIPFYQNWHLFGPLLGVGLFCFCVLLCNITILYKCQKRTMQPSNEGVAFQNQTTRIHHSLSALSQFDSDESYYESIDEQAMLGENDLHNRESANSYLDVIDVQSEHASYEIPTLVQNEYEHAYTGLRKPILLNASENEDDSMPKKNVFNL